MAATIEPKFQNWNKLLKRIDKRQKDMLRSRKIAERVYGPIVIADILRHFEEEEDSEGPWDDWSPSYAEQMSRQGKSGNKILQDTGRLRQGVKPGNITKAPGGFVWFNDMETKDGFPYAEAHDKGGSQLPQREFMWLSESAMDKIAEASLRFLLEL